MNNCKILLVLKCISIIMYIKTFFNKVYLFYNQTLLHEVYRTCRDNHCIHLVFHLRYRLNLRLSIYQNRFSAMMAFVVDWLILATKQDTFYPM